MPVHEADASSRGTSRSRVHRGHLGRRVTILAAILAAALTALGGGAIAAPPSGSGTPDFGPTVLISAPSMPTSQIQAAVDAVAPQQVSNQFGPQRYALLFNPGTYGTAATPLNFQVGY